MKNNEMNGVFEMNQNDWTDYFRALNSRDPLPEEFLAAKNKGEFVVESNQDQQEPIQKIVESNPKTSKGTKTTKRKVPNSIKAVFATLDKQWLFRQYVISILFAFFLFKTSTEGMSLTMLAIFTLLNPFARFVWLSIIEFFFRGVNVVYLIPFPWHLLVTVGVYGVVFAFSPPPCTNWSFISLFTDKCL